MSSKIYQEPQSAREDDLYGRGEVVIPGSEVYSSVCYARTPEYYAHYETFCSTQQILAGQFVAPLVIGTQLGAAVIL